MIQSKADYREYLELDLKALGINNNLINRFMHDIWKYQRLLRRYEYHINCSHGMLGKLTKLYFRYRLLKKGRSLGFSIPPNVFGSGLSIAHAGTIVVNKNAKVGKNCRLHVCVNIGADISDGTKAPTIGNDCYIGPGAKLYGNIYLGDNVGIGANAVVNKSFGSNLTIAGVPAKEISSKGPVDYRAKSL